MLLRRSLQCLSKAAASRRLVSSPSSLRALSTIIYKSPHPDIDIPDKTIWDVVQDNLPVHGDRDALVCGLTHEQVTYKDMHDSVKRLAVALAHDGVKKGDVVLLHSFNCMEYPISLLALNAIGAVCSTASPLFQAKELALQAKISNAKFIITHEQLADVAIEAAEIAKIDKDRVYAMGQNGPNKRLKCISEASKKEFEDFKWEPIDPFSNVLLPFSSGTTGMPKGVALSGKNMVANTMQISAIEDYGERMLGMLPFFHAYALFLVHVSLYQGCANVVLPRYTPETFLSTLEKYKIHKVNIAPPLALFLAHDPRVDNYDLSATEYLISAGAPLGKEVERLVEKRIGVKMKQLYGMTEMSPAVNYTEDGMLKPGTVGRIIPNTELRVKCTKTDKDLPRNEPGELLFRGPQVMIGYLNNPEANKSTLMEDGFLRTGDIGYIDDDGFVRIVDRVKELIKYKGHQVAPAELEDVLNHHPDVADSCAVRGFDENGDELPKAYVVLKDVSNPRGLTEEDIMAFVADRVAPYKKVRQVEFIPAIPKSISGKILRRQLQDRENERLQASQAAAA